MRSRFLLFFLIIFQLSLVLAIQPFGTNFTVGTNERAAIDTPQSHEAIAGNVTEINIVGFSPTQTWQGYFGNVSGTIQLADNSDDVMYNWSLASPQGEIYATTLATVAWDNIACFDLAGNHTALETLFTIASDDVDGVNETFSDSTDHDLFYTNNIQIDANSCAATNIYDSTGAGTAANFQEVLMTDGTADTAVIFTAILDEEDVLGFDNTNHDFEMLVLEDGHGTDTDSTTYYFYVELE